MRIVSGLGFSAKQLFGDGLLAGEAAAFHAISVVLNAYIVILLAKQS